MKFCKPLLILASILFFQTGVYANDVTFTAISDVCLKSDKMENNLTPSIQNLLRTKDDINNSGSKFVVFLGNNVAKADKYDLVMFANIINKIRKPVYAGLGNKDIQRAKRLDKEEYYRLLNKFSKNKIPRLPYAKNIDGFTFIFMDGTNEMASLPRGYFKDKELIALEKYLIKYKDKDVIIVQHFPILKMKEQTKTTYNRESYIKLLSGFDNVRAIISGHENEEFEIEDENGIKHINVPSLSTAKEYKVISIKKNDDKFSIKSKIISVE